MKDEIYVGNLVSPEELSHSAKGSKWKDHKYIKKIGDRYYYTQEELAKAAKKAGKAIGKAASDAQFELEWQAGRAADAVTKGFKDISGLTAREDMNRALSEQEKSKRLREGLRKAANDELDLAFNSTGKERERRLAKADAFLDKSREHERDADSWKEAARYHEKRYEKTPAGRIEGAASDLGRLKDKGVKTLSGLFERRKKLKKKKK